MDETSTSTERWFWDDVDFNPDPEDVVYREQADEVGFRGWIENLTTGEIEERLYWLETRAIPPMNALETKVIDRLLQLRRKFGLYMPEVVRQETGLPIDAVESVAAKGLAKFRLHEGTLVINQIVE